MRRRKASAGCEERQRSGAPCNVILGLRAGRGFLNHKTKDMGRLSDVRLAWPSPSDSSVTTRPRARRALVLGVGSGLSPQGWELGPSPL